MGSLINLADVIILSVIIAAGYFGARRGLAKQLSISIGLLISLLIISLVYQRLAFLAAHSSTRTVVLLLLLLAVGFISYDVFTRLGEWLANTERLKRWSSFGAADRVGGILTALVLTAATCWVVASMLRYSAVEPFRHQLDGSRFLRMTDGLIGTPNFLASTGSLLDPFGSPDVFVGAEPRFSGPAQTAIGQEFSKLDAAVSKVVPSVVEVDAWGCGSKAAGSGFLAGPQLVVTSAHVVAGADRISIKTGKRLQTARLVSMDTELDIAVLRLSADWDASPLVLNTDELLPGAIAGIIGYPGKELVTGDAVVLELVETEGYDIYGRNLVVRKIYAVRGSVESGNSGGVLINSDGEVSGLIFGQSTTQDKIGYAITADRVAEVLAAAESQTDAITTGTCIGR